MESYYIHFAMMVMVISTATPFILTAMRGMLMLGSVLMGMTTSGFFSITAAFLMSATTTTMLKLRVRVTMRVFVIVAVVMSATTLPSMVMRVIAVFIFMMIMRAVMAMRVVVMSSVIMP